MTGRASASTTDVVRQPAEDAQPHANRELRLAVPGELIETIARRAAVLVSEEAGRAPEPFVGVKEAARHLACEPHRIYDLVQRRAIPSYKEGSRLLFRRSELDAWLARTRR